MSMPQPAQPSGFSQLVAELKRRHVVRFALGYGAAAFVVLQLAEIVFPAFGIGEDGLRLLVVLTGLGFIPALVLAWVYDITTEGVKRTDDEEGAGQAPPSRLAVAALLMTTLVVTAGLVLYLIGQGALSAPADAEVPTGVPAVRSAAYDPGEPIRSVAVLPLDDYSPSGDQAYFTSGMHEELIAKLSMIEDLRVVSRTTVMRYADPASRPASPQLGRELGVDVLVEGSVTRGNEQVRVTLQIIHAASDSHIRTLQWEQPVTDVLAFQTEVAHALVDAIRTDHDHRTFTSQTTASAAPAAQEAYLRARHEYDRGTPEGYRAALQYFEAALDEDPEFAPAMAGAAGARFLVGLEDSAVSEVELTRAREDAAHALAMDSTSTEAREVLSFIERGMPRVTGSIPAPSPVARAGATVVTLPGSPDSIVVNVGAFDTAWVSAITGLGTRIEEQVRRRTLGAQDERPGGRQAAEARFLIGAGRYRDAARALEAIVDEAPEIGSAWDMLARSYIAAGDPRRAAGAMRRWHDSGTPDAPDEAWVRRLEQEVELRGEEGYWTATLERLTAEEEAGLDVSRVEIAAAHAALGQDDEAFQYLAEALERGEPGILSLRSDPVWDDLRRDPRFREVAREALSLRFSPSRRPPRAPSPRR